MNGKSLQEQYAPGNACFGCGPANPKGLHIRSFAEGDDVVAEWQAESQYEAFPGMLCGGIIGTLLDCHSNWAATHHLMRKAGADHPPCTVTADFAVKLLRPTPTAGPADEPTVSIPAGWGGETTDLPTRAASDEATLHIPAREDTVAERTPPQLDDEATETVEDSSDDSDEGPGNAHRNKTAQ